MRTEGRNSKIQRFGGGRFTCKGEKGKCPEEMQVDDFEDGLGEPWQGKSGLRSANQVRNKSDLN